MRSYALAVVAALAAVPGSASSAFNGAAGGRGPAAGVVVLVTDRSTADPMPAVSVRVSQGGKIIESGITGPNGSVEIRGVTPGRVTVLCEKEGYQRRPEEKQATVGEERTSVRVTLLAEARDAEYYRRAGRNIDAEGRGLASSDRSEFYRQEWARAKVLRAADQPYVARELTFGKQYLASDREFQYAMLKVEGVHESRLASNTMNGTVKSITANSIILTTKVGEQTFTIDRRTNVTAVGASHKSETMKEEKKKPQITDFVLVGDTVTVSYHDMGATKQATTVRVVQKGSVDRR